MSCMLLATAWPRRSLSGATLCLRLGLSATLGLTASHPMMVRLSQLWWAESPEHAPRRIIFPSLGSAGFEEKLLSKGTHGIVVKGREAHT